MNKLSSISKFLFAFILGLGSGSAALPIDAVSAPAQTPAPRPCKKTTITIPPTVNDPVFGLWLVTQAQQIVTDSKAVKCLTFIDTAQSREYLSYVGFSPFRFQSAPQLGNKQLSILEEELGASQLMVLSYSGTKKRELTIKLYEIRTDDDDDRSLKLVQKFRTALEENDVKKRKGSLVQRYISFFTPNAVMLGQSQTEISITPREDYKSVKTTNISGLPAFLTSFSTGTIEHPDAFSLFDASAAISPRFILFNLDQRTKIRKIDGSDSEESPYEKDLSIRSLGACETIDAIGSIYWPLGTTYASIGVGPCYYSVQQEDTAATSRFDYGFRYAFGHRAFLTHNLFVYLDVQGYVLGQTLYHTDFGISDNIFRATAGVGWYIADAENRFAKFWRFGM